MKKNKRNFFFINPSFQFKFILYSMNWFLVAIISIMCSLNYFFWKFNQMGINAQLPANHIFFTFISDQKFQMNLIIGIVSLITILLTLIGGIVMSHKIAGPIYRFCEDLKKMNKENINEIKFREGDFFLEVSEDFNNFIKRL